MKRQLMAEQWDQFARALRLENCSLTEQRDMRRAFYAGAEAILIRVLKALAPESEPTNADIQLMEDLYQELRDFAAQVKARRA
jgi:hypothetical protein